MIKNTKWTRGFLVFGAVYFVLNFFATQSLGVNFAKDSWIDLFIASLFGGGYIFLKWKDKKNEQK